MDSSSFRQVLAISKTSWVGERQESLVGRKNGVVSNRVDLPFAWTCVVYLGMKIKIGLIKSTVARDFWFGGL
jgi:hypothetical protein